ncbi:MAG: YdeI/OmpD-associated family protein [Actinomycetota bacterium]
MDVRYFRSPAEFRAWLKRHHASEPEVYVGYYKKGSGRRGITHPEALDEALCFGWIDGVRRSVDGERYTNRFSPRTPNSYWSTVNTARAKALIESGRMQPAGLAAFERRDEQRTRMYSFEQANPALSRAEAATFRKNRAAWLFWQAQPPGYRKTATWWVVSAKRDETRRRRLETLIEHSANGDRISQVIPPRARRPA